MNTPLIRLQVLFSSLLLFTHSIDADDWPQWRGPKRDGVWRENGIIEKFKGDRIPVRWRAQISGGYSGPTVADGRVYVSDRVTKPEQVERVHCFDWKTGKNIWTHTYDCVYRKVGYAAGPRASVLINDGRAYSLGSMGHLFCFNAKTGGIHWSKDLYSEYRIRMPIWGIASSPIIEGNLLIVQVGGEGDACLVAFDRKSGKEVWRALPDRASYSAPVIIEQSGKQVLVCWTGDRIVGLEPGTGKLHWEYPTKPKRMVLAIASPVIHKNWLFLSGFYDGSFMLRLHSDELKISQIWQRRGVNEKQTDSLHSLISTPIIHNDLVFGVDSYGELRCLDPMTGNRIWSSDKATRRARWSTIHFVLNGDKVWMFNEMGELIISRLSRSGFDEISRARLIDPTLVQLRQRGGVCWSHPAYAYKHVFARNDEELVCANLSLVE